MAPEDPLTLLHAPVARWFREAFGAPTPAQARAIPAILAGEHVLVASPTGSGKTLAGFLALLSELARLGPALEERPYVVYVSPLKALVNDVARNLQAPLAGIRDAALRAGEPAPEIRVALRTGDTSQAERARMLRAPPHVLVTTPESLALLLASEGWRSHLERVRWVVVDEVHDLAPTKRGAHLSLLLERLDALVARPPVRVGLSATVAPLEEAARFLTGGRPCRLVAVPAREPPRLHVELVPADPVRASADDAEDALVARLQALVEAHRTTIVFTNTRRAAERLALRLHGALGDPEDPAEDDASHDPAFAPPEPAPPVATHHGSMSRESRLVVEDRLKRGDLRCVVASSSLELGIDVRGVDHVVLVGSPKSSARTLQRLGRSRHEVGAIPEGTLIVQDPADLAEALALRSLVEARAIEPLRALEAPLDVLAQHLVASTLEGPLSLDDALALAQRAWGYRGLERSKLEDVAASVPWLAREGAALRALPGARLTYLRQAGTIPETARVRVLHGERFVGEVEETYAEALEPGNVFRLAGANWKLVRAAPTSLHVEPARGLAPSVPDWKGEGLGATPLVAAATRERLFGSQSHASHDTDEAWERYLAWRALLPFGKTPDEVPAEVFVSDEGRRVLAIHAVAGRRVHEALARALAHRLALRLGEPVHAHATDLGLALAAPRRWKPGPRNVAALLEAPLERDLRAALAGSDLLKRRFRHVATRSLLLVKRDDEPLSRRQREANGLLARLPPDHPLVEEAWREATRDALDVDGADALRETLRSRLTILREGPTPLGIRILARLEDPLGREVIREAEDFARGEKKEGVPRGFGEAVKRPQDAPRSPPGSS